MWKRAQLKERAKTAFKNNYWKAVLISLIAGVLGIGGFSAGQNVQDTITNNVVTGNSSYVTSYSYDEEDWDDDWNDEEDWDDDDDDYSYAYSEDDIDPAFLRDGLAVTIVMIITAVAVGLVILVAAFVADAFLINPIEIGCKRFFLRNLGRPSLVREIAYAFDHCYKNIVKTMFLRDLYVFLWSLLFIIPGIVKSYEYRMIPYILAEHPDMPKEQVFEISKRMMNGQKWKTFVLDLSFIGWNILSAISFGLVGIFYVNPYKQSTAAALYEVLKYGPGEYENDKQPYFYASDQRIPQQPFV